jgi:signal transduction histidine kinase
MVCWHSRKYLDNNYVFFLGVAYLFVAGIDSIHTLSYKGMGIFQSAEANIPTQLWIGGRYLQSLSLLAGLFFLRRTLSSTILFCSYLLVTALILASIFYWRIFPDCFIEGAGLTPFKKISEYVISAILLTTIGLLLKKRQMFEPRVLRLLVISITLTIGSELAFTFYVSVYGLSNLVGHFFKIFAYYLIYRAIIDTGLTRPCDLLFRNLKLSEEKFKGLYSAMNEGVCLHELIYDQEGKAIDYRIIDVNPAFETILGLKRKEAMQSKASELYKTGEPPYLEIFVKVAETGEPVSFETHFPPMEKDFAISVFSPDKDRFATVFTDITERKEFERQLRESHELLEQRVEKRTEQLKTANSRLLHAEKLSAIGRLSASIAHEVNNPLFAIRNILAGIHRRVSLEEEDEELVRLAIEECDRIKRLILDLQSFNRPTSGVVAPVDIHPALDRITMLLRKELKNKKISLEKYYAPHLPAILAVEDQLKQVFLNLLNNAVDAVGDNGGKITVSTQVLSGNEVAIHFKDTGKGMGAEEMKQIFEPFFTTKTAVKGTGLGLSVSYGIVKRHSGRISVVSELGRGSAFTVFLPVEGAGDGGGKRNFP